MANPAPSNIPEWTVSSLSGALKRTLEDAYGHVRVRGEISGYRGPHSSGHCYFALKEENAKIEAVIWKGVFSRLTVRPEEGMEVIATGRITTFPGSSKYQIVIEAIEPAGLGALMALLEERRRKLVAEGLFDEARKKPLPYLPEVIGVVTSPTGAVIRDILHRLSERFPRHVIVWPVRVQGETSGAEVAAAIRGFNALPEGGPIARPDVLIVARGGGSLEDLWGFNDEEVVRAAAASTIPLIAAVGHETDWTLIDYAADLRAPTPTGAAEKAVPVRADLMGQVLDLARRQIGAVQRLRDQRRADLRGLARALPGREDVLAGPRQRLDAAGMRLVPALMRGLDLRHRALARLGASLATRSPYAELRARRATFNGAAQRLNRNLLIRLHADKAARLGELAARLDRARALQARQTRERIGTERATLATLGERLASGLAQTQARKAERLAGLDQLLRTLSHKGVLARGYALVMDDARHLVRSAGMVQPGMALHLQFADGEAQAVGAGRAGPRKRTSAPETPKQGGLFDR